MKEVLLLVELVYWSTALEGERNPVSMVLVASPESGKTDIVRAYADTNYSQLVTDLTAWGMVQEVIPQAQNGKVLLVIPDLSIPLARAGPVTSSLIGFILAYCEEGVGRVATKFLQLDPPRPVAGGILSSCTKDQFERWRKRWGENGFLSRFLVVSYSYGGDVQEVIRLMALGRENKGSDPAVVLPLPKRKVSIAVTEDIQKLINSMFEDFAKEYMEEIEFPGYGFRAARQFRRLIYAAALRAGRNYVSHEDVHLVHGLARRYCNLSYSEAM